MKDGLTKEQKRLDIDIWIILLITLGVFLLYVIAGNQINDFVKNENISIVPRLLLLASIQFGVAGLGITMVCILRKEKFTQFGLTKKNMLIGLTQQTTTSCNRPIYSATVVR